MRRLDVDERALVVVLLLLLLVVVLMEVSIESLVRMLRVMPN